MSIEAVAHWLFSGIQTFEITFIVLGVLWCLAMEGRHLTSKERYRREVPQRRT